MLMFTSYVFYLCLSKSNFGEIKFPFSLCRRTILAKQKAFSCQTNIPPILPNKSKKTIGIYSNNIQ